MAQNRARNWNLVLNGDNLPNTNEIIAKLAEIRAKNYAFIYHNDNKVSKRCSYIKKDNEDKRKHIHLVIEFENARTIESLKKKLDAWHIEPCRNLALSLQYLTHKNAPDKEIVVVSNIPSFTTKTEPTKFNTRWEEATPKIKQLTAQRGHGYLDLGYYIQDHYGRMPEIYCKDEFHINDEGNLVWVKLLRFCAQFESEGGSLK